MSIITGIEDFLRELNQDHLYIRNVVATEHREAHNPQYADIPSGLSPEIAKLLQEMGIASLYSHQSTAIESILNRQNTLISSGVASGKSLCYQLPILNNLLSTCLQTLCSIPPSFGPGPAAKEGSPELSLQKLLPASTFL